MINGSLTRDESWVRFNERVLQEAQNPEIPLYERLKFLAIYSSNFDEFFRVRIARLRESALLKKKDRTEEFKKPNQQLKSILTEVKRLQKSFEDVFFKEIVPELKKEGTEFLFLNDVAENQKQFIHNYFELQIKDKLTITPLNQGSNFPFLENNELYFILEFADGTTSLCNIPSDLERFIRIPVSSSKYDYSVMFIDDIIRYGLREQYIKNKLLGCYVIKLTRNADFDIEDEFSGNLIEKLKEEIEKRDLGVPTRLLYDSSMPKTIRKNIRKSLGLHKLDTIPGGRYHNFSDFFSFPNFGNNPEFTYEDLPPLPHPFLEGKNSIIDEVNKKNILISVPYQKFDYIPQLLRESALSPDVTHIKMTLYRISKDSSVAKALLLALANGKKVSLFIEAKARFDETNNLLWGAKLEQAGANVRYSYPGIKVHTKLMLIKTSNNEQNKDIAYIGTGNFNEKTARIYCDHGLLTTEEVKLKDVKKVFKLLEGRLLVPKATELLVSPFNTREKLIQFIDKEINHALNGKEAHIIFKMNSFEDPEIINKLYEANRAGVKIDLIVRGFCCLVPGVEGMSENIRAISIIDRFLEHARVYYFSNNGNPRYYLGSADLMIRNLDNRVEVLTPVKDKHITKILKFMLEIQLKDNVKARIIDAGQNNEFVERKEGEPKIRSQYELYEYFKKISQKGK